MVCLVHDAGHSHAENVRELGGTLLDADHRGERRHQRQSTTSHGLNRIYVQAKRYQAGNTVGSEEMGNFLCTMSEVDRCVFLTTGTFTEAAEREFEGRGVRVVLIKGAELVDLMVGHGVGVEPIRVATIHRINEDFFDELWREIDSPSQGVGE